jgi:DNA-binding transcriptional ArsR family regulator
MKEFEKTLKALANRRRLAIVKFLKEKKEANVGEISQHIKLSYKATSKHLLILSGSDILDHEKRSLEIYYSLNPKLTKLAHSIISLL